MLWYLLQSKPRQEHLAVLNLMHLGVEAFSPHLTRSKMIRRKVRSVTEQLFPGYLFAKFDAATEYRKVTHAFSVRNVVTFGSVLAMVDEETIELIHSRVDGRNMVVQPSSFTPGQIVRIGGGPLCGVQAVFERELSGSQRVILLLNAVSYQARMTIDREHVIAV